MMRTRQGTNRPVRRGNIDEVWEIVDLKSKAWYISVSGTRSEYAHAYRRKSFMRFAGHVIDFDTHNEQH